jgi:hypothetical protein
MISIQFNHIRQLYWAVIEALPKYLQAAFGSELVFSIVIVIQSSGQRSAPGMGKRGMRRWGTSSP